MLAAITMPRQEEGLAEDVETGLTAPGKRFDGLAESWHSGAPWRTSSL